MICPKVVVGAVVKLSPLLLPEETVCSLLLVGAVLVGGLVLVSSTSEPLEVVVGLPVEFGVEVRIDVGGWTEVLDDVGLLVWVGASVVVTGPSVGAFVDVAARAPWWVWTVLGLIVDVLASLPVNKDNTESSQALARVWTSPAHLQLR